MPQTPQTPQASTHTQFPSPQTFLEETNAHIGRQREAYPECRSLPEAHALLTLDEVLAVRLYTGPGYQPLNAFLRQLGRVTGTFRAHMARHAGLTFTATVGHLCWALRKLAAVTPPHDLALPLYRGVRGELPRAFWAPDDQRVVCAIDAGFMSTSRDKCTPTNFMGGGANVLWVLHPAAESDTAYHMGASVRTLSQYAEEEEVLFPPCTMLVVKERPPGAGLAASVGSEGSAVKDALCVSQGTTVNQDGHLITYQAIEVTPFFV